MREHLLKCLDAEDMEPLFPEWSGGTASPRGIHYSLGNKVWGIRCSRGYGIAIHSDTRHPYVPPTNQKGPFLYLRTYEHTYFPCVLFSALHPPSTFSPWSGVGLKCR